MKMERNRVLLIILANSSMLSNISSSSYKCAKFILCILIVIVHVIILWYEFKKILMKILMQKGLSTTSNNSSMPRALSCSIDSNTKISQCHFNVLVSAVVLTNLEPNWMKRERKGGILIFLANSIMLSNISSSSFKCAKLSLCIFIVIDHVIINRPGVAGAVLQTPS